MGSPYTSMIFAGQYAKSLADNGFKFKTGEAIRYYAGGDPNGVVTEAKGSVIFDVTSPKLWLNTAGGTAWSELVALTAASTPLEHQRLIFDGSGWITAYQQEHITEVVPGDFTAGEYTIPVLHGIYYIDATGLGNVIVKLPNAVAGNDDQYCRIIVQAMDSGSRVEVTTVGGTQLIGNMTQQYIADVGKGFTAASHFPELAYLVPQDSRGTFPNDGAAATTIITTNRFLNYTQGTSVVSGLGITKNVGAGTIDIGSGEVIMRSTAAGPNGILTAYQVAANAGVAIADKTPTYIKLDGSGGTPVTTITTNPADFNSNTTILTGYVFRNGTTYMDTFEPMSQSLNFVNRWATRDFFVNGVVRASGSVLSSPTGFRLALTAGLFYSVLTPISTASFNSTGADTWTRMYRDGVGGYVRQTGRNVVDNTVYDNNTGTPVAMSPGRYGVSYFWWQFNSPNRLIQLMGTAQYSTIADAQAAAQQIPATLPPELQQGPVTYFIGSVVYRQSGSTFENIYNRTATAFTGATAANHNNLAGLQGGTALEYYHLTAAQHSNLTGGAPSFATSVTTPRVTTSGALGLGDVNATAVNIGNTANTVTTNIYGATINIGQPGGTVNLLGTLNSINATNVYVPNALEVDGILYADGGIRRATAAALSIGGGLTTGVTVVPAATFNAGIAQDTAAIIGLTQAPSGWAGAFGALYSGFDATATGAGDYALLYASAGKNVGLAVGSTSVLTSSASATSLLLPVTFSGGFANQTISGAVTWSGAQTFSAGATVASGQTLLFNTTANILHDSSTRGNIHISGPNTVTGISDMTDRVVSYGNNLYWDGTNLAKTETAIGGAALLMSAANGATGGFEFIALTDTDNATVTTVSLATLKNTGINLKVATTLGAGGTLTGTFAGTPTWSGAHTFNDGITVTDTGGPLVAPFRSGAVGNGGYIALGYETTNEWFIGRKATTGDWELQDSLADVIIGVNKSTNAITLSKPVTALNPTSASTAVIEMNTSSDAYSSHIKIGRSTTEDAEIGVGASSDLMITGAGGGDLNFLVNGSSRGINWSVDSGTSIAMRLGSTGALTVGPASGLTGYHTIQNSATAGEVLRVVGNGSAGAYLGINDPGNRSWYWGIDNGVSTFFLRESSYTGTSVFEALTGGNIRHNFYTQLGESVDGGGTTPAFAVKKVTGRYTAGSSHIISFAHNVTNAPAAIKHVEVSVEVGDDGNWTSVSTGAWYDSTDVAWRQCYIYWDNTNIYIQKRLANDATLTDNWNNPTDYVCYITYEAS